MSSPREDPVDDIFGGDSDLSDVSEDERPSNRRARSATPASPKGANGTSAAADDDGDDDDEEDYDAGADRDEDEGEEYRETGGPREEQIKKLKVPKKKRSTEEADESGPVKKRKKPRKDRAESAEREVEPEEDIDPDTARRRALAAQLDAIVKRPANKNGRRKRGDDEEDLEMLNDEAIVKMKNDMLTAADQDIEDNEAGRFAVHKLRLLPQVVKLMQKSALAESLMENGILDAVSKWLEPLPDKSLPAVNIQRPLLEILRGLTIETSALKSSGLGKIVYFYTKCKRVEPSIQRVADQLVRDWMRPILRRSKEFADKQIYEEDYPPRPSQSQARGAKKDEPDSARRHARIPEALTTTYKRAPQLETGERGQSSMSQGHSSAGGSDKMRGYKKKLVASTQASRRI